MSGRASPAVALYSPQVERRRGCPLFSPECHIAAVAKRCLQERGKEIFVAGLASIVATVTVFIVNPSGLDTCSRRRRGICSHFSRVVSYT